MSKIALIKKRIETGLPKKRIASEVGCSLSYVYLVEYRFRDPQRYFQTRRETAKASYRAHIERCPPPPPRGWTDEEYANALDMKRSGKSASQIASALNRSRNSVIGRLWRAGA